jgi:hypothetical protein
MVMSLVVTTVAAKGFAKLAKTNGQKTNDTRMPRNNRVSLKPMLASQVLGTHLVV